MKRSFKSSNGVRGFFTIVCLLLSGIFLFSFKSSKKERAKNQTLAGIWADDKTVAPGVPASIKVFEAEGTYYNLGFENGTTIITHKGTYKVVDGTNYIENVTNARFNGTYDLQGNRFNNKYELSRDQQRLVLRGKVYSKNGRDSLMWTESYKRVQIP